MISAKIIHQNTNIQQRTLWLCLLAAAIVFQGIFIPGGCLALESYEILVLANKNSPKGLSLAHYYMKKRGIWSGHMLELDITDREVCSRTEYNNQIAKPVRKYLNTTDNRMLFSCIVLMYGLPLKISPTIDQKDSGASVDSEIALLYQDNYPLSGWRKNPLFQKQDQEKDRISLAEILMVSRLDGPTAQSVKRIIDDSFLAEKTGLSGTAYFDARWKKENDQKNAAYHYYDQSLHQIAEMMTQQNIIPVVLDEDEEVFQERACPDTALYCGWYSLARYVDAFDWRPGAVGYHIASTECTTLKRQTSKVWCKMMIQKGIAATLGPVDEPYVSAFPPPALFFSLLTSGKFTLVESYMASLPHLSWQMVLIGDPLYNPFQNRSGR
jgi:uncharacterized protein (TIGR03790 family)